MGRPRPLARPAIDAPERELDAYVAELCRRHGWLTYHVVRPEHGRPGFPDRTISKGDVFGIVELKRDLGPKGGTTRSAGAGVLPTDEQRAWLDAGARARWLLSALWRPSDAERIEAFLSGDDAQKEPPGIWLPGGSLSAVNRG